MKQTDRSTRTEPLRLWPGVVIGVLLFLTWIVVPRVVPNAPLFAVLGGAVGALAVVVWWVFFSRASWSGRLDAVAGTIVGLLATPYFHHESSVKGNVGVQF